MSRPKLTSTIITGLRALAGRIDQFNQADAINAAIAWIDAISPPPPAPDPRQLAIPEVESLNAGATVIEGCVHVEPTLKPIRHPCSFKGCTRDAGHVGAHHV